MNTQAVWGRSAPARRRLQTLRGGWVMSLGATGGRLEVMRGRVWVTRAGDLDDHVVESGDALEIPAWGEALVQAWDDAQPAVVAWQATSVGERAGSGVRSALGRCWEIVDPVRRIGAGALAAIVALLSGALLFGPLSESSTRALLAPTLLHNSAGARSSIGFAAGTRTGANDVSGERARVTAQEARRRAPGAA